MTTGKKFYMDVVVCGGGVAGAAAGISAARNGMRTMLLESRESLGGLCTNGYITGIAGHIEGICKEWLERLHAEGHAVMKPHLPTVEPEYGKLMLEEMLLQAGCRILYGATVIDCVVEDGRIKKIIAYSKSGKIEIYAKVFIDATGDADLAFMAGAPCEVGCAEFMGLNQSVTMGFRLSYVNLEKYKQANAEWNEYLKTRPPEEHCSLIVHKEKEAIENGDLHELLSPGNLVYPMPVGNPECTDVTLDATHTFDCRCDDVEDLSRQIVDQHRKVVWFVDFLKKYVPGFENAVLTGLASMNGVRDSRRIIGEYIFTAYDIGNAKKFDDRILLHPECYDAHIPVPGHHTASRHIHHPVPVENAICRPSQDDDDHIFHPFVRPGGYEVRVNPRLWCEFPFRSLIATEVDNLLAAGRCASADYHAIGSVRVIAASMAMGQAAGTGAAMVVKAGVKAIRELEGKLVREELIKQGVPLDQPPGGYWENIRNFKGEPKITHNDYVCLYNEKGEHPFIW